MNNRNINNSNNSNSNNIITLLSYFFFNLYIKRNIIEYSN